MNMIFKSGRDPQLSFIGKIVINCREKVTFNKNKIIKNKCEVTRKMLEH